MEMMLALNFVFLNSIAGGLRGSSFDKIENCWYQQNLQISVAKRALLFFLNN